MRVIVDLCVVPMGVGVSVSEYVAACERVLQQAGLATRLHACGTNIEGEWDDVFAAIKRCHEVVHEMGAPRITKWLANVWRKTCHPMRRMPASFAALQSGHFVAPLVSIDPSVAENTSGPRRG